MKGIDSAQLAQLIGTIITMLIAAAGWLTSYFNRRKLDENTKITQANADNHAETMDKLNTLATKVVTVVAAEPQSPLEKPSPKESP